MIWVDSLKGWLITLVVLGHAIKVMIGDACYDNHLWNIIYSFHMPAFMAVSGFVSYRKKIVTPEGKDGQSLLYIIIRRFRQLMIPFFFWTLITLLAYNQLSLSKLWSFIMYPDKGLWFLWALFFISLLFNICCRFAVFIKILDIVIVLLLSALLTVSMVIFNFRIFGFQFIAYYFMFYSIGFYLNKYKIWAYPSVRRLSLVLYLLFIIWCILAWFWEMHDIPAPLREFHLPSTMIQYTYRFVTAVIAIYLIFAFSPKILSSTNKWNLPFIDMGKFSLGIYAIHLIIIRLLKSFDWNTTLLVVVSFIVGLLGSWLFVRLLNRWKYSSMFLLGKI